MRITFALYLISLLGLSLMSYGDEVIWSYDLTILPPGWQTDKFEFVSNGARYYSNVDWYNCINSTGFSDYLRTETVIIPDGLDSLVLIVPQYLHLIANSQYWGSAHAKTTIDAYVDYVKQCLWSQEVNSMGLWDELTDTTTIHEVVTGLNSDQSVYFEFIGYQSGWEGWTLIDWRLFNAQLIGYGDLNLL